MKKKFLTKLTGILLSAAMVFSTIPVNAGTTVTSDVSAETAVTSETQTVEDIFTFDWKNATVDEINEAVYDADFDDLGAWLLSMPEEEKEELLSKETYLHNEVQLLTMDEDGNTVPVEGTIGSENPELWEYAIAQVPATMKASDTAVDMMKSSSRYFSASSGCYYYKFYVDGVNYTYKMAVSDISKSTDVTTTADAVSLVLVIPSGVPSWLGITSSAGTTDTERKLRQAWRSSSQAFTGNYTTLRNGINFTKPAGYTCTYTTDAGDSWIYYYDGGNYETSRIAFNGSTNSQGAERYELLTYVHMADAGIALTKGDGTVTKEANGKKTFQFYLNPITYYMNYHGNGATSGATAQQACIYDKTYTPSGNGFVRKYGIAYNANGGSASKTNETISYDFAGWGFENASQVTHTTSTAFANVSTVHGGLGGTFYAIWQPKATTLATASRTGYTFGGWVNHLNGAAYGAGTSYTPPADTQFTAAWTPNKYTVKFNSNGGTACSNISATYNTPFNLPTPTRSGYTFTGWSGAGRTFAGSDLKSVKNLTATNNDIVTLTATWEVRNDIPYTVVHKKETGPNTGVYEEYERETLYGTTGNSVTPATKNYEGYTFNEEESDGTKQIAGNGSTEFEYKYDVDVPESVPYTVEYYLQDPVTKEYILDENNLFVFTDEEGVSVTPDVITTYVGYDVPNPQTITLAAGKDIVIKYYYKLSNNISYKVIHMLQTAEGSDEYEEYEVESMTGTHGDSVTPAVKNYDGYVSPQVQTVTVAGDGSTVVEYLYDIRVKDMASYRVEHYLQDKSTGEYVLDENTVEEHEVADGTSVTPDVITSYTGYVVPTPQTITVKADSENVVKYYYSLAGADSVYIENNDNSSKGDANNFKAGDVKYYTDKDGNTYKILVNSDGTLTVQSIKTAGKSKSNLTVSSTITINGVKYTVTEIAPYAFKNNKTIKTVKIGNGIKKIGKGAFKNCSRLKKVTYGTALEVIESQAFYGCKSLETVKTNKALTKIGSKAFYNCKKLKSYTVGKYVKVIGTSAFQNCKKLKKITIAESVEIIEKKAFYGCSKLKNVHVKTTKLIKIGKQAFKKCDKKIGFVVPEKKKKAYVKLLKNKY